MKHKPIVCEQLVTVFQDPGLTVPLGAELPPGTEIQMGQSVGKAVAVVLGEGIPGYISGESKVRVLQDCFLNQDEAVAYEECSQDAPVTHRFVRGDEFCIVEVVKDVPGSWIKIRDINGGPAFMDGKVGVLMADKLREGIATDIGKGVAHALIVKALTKALIPGPTAERLVAEVEQAVKEYRATPEARRQLASAYARRMFIGLLWAIGGTAVTVWGYQSASSSRGGGRYMVFWGAIIFGAIEFFRGLFGWIRYSR